jgi:hypothetical protein
MSVSNGSNLANIKSSQSISFNERISRRSTGGNEKTENKLKKKTKLQTIISENHHACGINCITNLVKII